VKVGALCIKKEGAHFDTPSFTVYVLKITLPHYNRVHSYD
jgi:hypothetical protein